MLTSRSTFIGVISPAFWVTPDEDAVLSLQDTSVLVHELTTNKISLAVNTFSLAGLFAVFYTTQLAFERALAVVLPSFGNSEDFALTTSDFNEREDHQHGHHQGLDSLARLR